MNPLNIIITVALWLLFYVLVSLIAPFLSIPERIVLSGVILFLAAFFVSRL